MKIQINRQPTSVLKLASALIDAEGVASDRTMKPHDVYAYFAEINVRLDFISRTKLKGTQLTFYGCFPCDGKLTPKRYESEATCFKARHNGICWVIYEIFRAPGKRPNTEIKFSDTALEAMQEHFSRFSCW